MYFKTVYAQFKLRKLSERTLMLLQDSDVISFTKWKYIVCLDHNIVLAIVSIMLAIALTLVFLSLGH